MSKASPPSSALFVSQEPPSSHHASLAPVKQSFVSLQDASNRYYHGSVGRYSRTFGDRLATGDRNGDAPDSDLACDFGGLVVYCTRNPPSEIAGSPGLLQRRPLHCQIQVVRICTTIRARKSFLETRILCTGLLVLQIPAVAGETRAIANARYQSGMPRSIGPIPSSPLCSDKVPIILPPSAPSVASPKLYLHC